MSKRVAEYQKKAPGQQLSQAACKTHIAHARIADAIYEDSANGRARGVADSGLSYVGDWTTIFDDKNNLKDLAIFAANKSDFSAGVFEDPASNTVYIAFRGSDSEKDFKGTNLPAILGKETTQYHLAAAIGREANDKFAKQGKKVVFVGHSLGGGLAQQATLASGQPSVVFNSAGMSKREDGVLRQRNLQGAITNISIPGEAIQTATDVLGPPGLWAAKQFDLTTEEDVRLTQVGNRYWIPDVGNCKAPVDQGREKLIGSKALGVAVPLFRKLPPPANIAVGAGTALWAGADALWETGKAAVEQSIDRHKMQAVHKALEACADGSVPSPEKATGEPSTSQANASPTRGEGSATQASAQGTAASNEGGGASSGGDGMKKPPKIKYKCVLSACD
jgi:hypothetical protein